MVLHSAAAPRGDRPAYQSASAPQRILRVVIVDRRAAMRAILAAGLGRERHVHVVGLASNPIDAERIVSAHRPDVVVVALDLAPDQAPAIRVLAEKADTAKIILLSADRVSQIEAREIAQMHGAYACCGSREAHRGGVERMLNELAALIGEAGDNGAKPQPHARAKSGLAVVEQSAPAPPCSVFGGTDIIAIGASTGGIEALQTMLARFSAECPPTLIVQRVNARFVGTIATVLDNLCGARVCIARHGQRLYRGEVYLAPGDDRHLTLAPGAVPRIRLAMDAPDCGPAPSVDALFASLAIRRDLRGTGVLLTGMGRDGAAGLLAMARAGHHTIAQDEESSAVFGMPRAAISLGAAREVLGLPDITNALVGQAA